MTQVVVAEVFVGNEWKLVGAVSGTSPAGSLSSYPPDTPRQVFMFGWHDDVPGVWRSLAGFDEETPDYRVIASLGLERVADLNDGPCTLTIWRKGRRQMRFTLRDDMEGMVFSK